MDNPKRLTLKMQRDIDEKAVDKVHDFLVDAKEKQPEEIVIICDGTGGIIDCAFAIYEMIRNFSNNHPDIDVIGVVLGGCVSSSVYTWCGCGSRYIAPHGYIGVHSLTVTGYEGETMDLRDSRARAIRLSALESKLYSILMSVSNQNVEWWQTVFIGGSSDYVVMNPGDLAAIEMTRLLPENFDLFLT